MEVLATDEAPLSEPLRRALDALLDGRPIPDDTRARLTSAERAHLSGLAATSTVARIVLQSPVPSPPAEAASLQKAQARIVARPNGVGAGAPAPGAPDPPQQRENWFRRWRRNRNSSKGSKKR
jgi:hypothetical protein